MHVVTYNVQYISTCILKILYQLRKHQIAFHAKKAISLIKWSFGLEEKIDVYAGHECGHDRCHDRLDTYRRIYIIQR
jgi:hypothetical protein